MKEVVLKKDQKAAVTPLNEIRRTNPGSDGKDSRRLHGYVRAANEAIPVCIRSRILAALAIQRDSHRIQLTTISAAYSFGYHHSHA